MKTVINASPAMKALIDAQMQKRGFWPWASKKTVTVDKYRLQADDKTQRVSGRVTINGREKSLGRELKQQLSEAHFYERRAAIWSQSEQALDMTFARPTPRPPVRRRPNAPPQGISGLFENQSGGREDAMLRPTVPMRTSATGTFEGPRQLGRFVQRLEVPLTHPSQAWAASTQHLVDAAFARYSEDSTRSSKAPSLHVPIPHIEDFWGAELGARFVPVVRQIEKRQLDALTVPMVRQSSYVAQLFDAADQFIAHTKRSKAAPLMPKKSILRTPTPEMRRLREQLADYASYSVASLDA